MFNPLNNCLLILKANFSLIRWKIKINRWIIHHKMQYYNILCIVVIRFIIIFKNLKYFFRWIYWSFIDKTVWNILFKSGILIHWSRLNIFKYEALNFKIIWIIIRFYCDFLSILFYLIINKYLQTIRIFISQYQRYLINSIIAWYSTINYNFLLHSCLILMIY